MLRLVDNFGNSTHDLAPWYTGATASSPQLTESYEFSVTSLTVDNNTGTPESPGKISIMGVLFYENSTTTLQTGATLPTSWHTIADTAVQNILRIEVGTAPDQAMITTVVIQIRKSGNHSCTTTLTVPLSLLKGSPGGS